MKIIFQVMSHMYDKFEYLDIYAKIIVALEFRKLLKYQTGRDKGTDRETDRENIDDKKRKKIIAYKIYFSQCFLN